MLLALGCAIMAYACYGIVTLKWKQVVYPISMLLVGYLFCVLGMLYGI